MKSYGISARDVARFGQMDAAQDLAAATPTTRNRYADLIRVVAIGVVVIGHWLMAVLGFSNGKFTGVNPLEIQPRLRA
jgi:hypothetical protein